VCGGGVVREKNRERGGTKEGGFPSVCIGVAGHWVPHEDPTYMGLYNSQKDCPIYSRDWDCLQQGEKDPHLKKQAVHEYNKVRPHSQPQNGFYDSFLPVSTIQTLSGIQAFTNDTARMCPVDLHHPRLCLGQVFRAEGCNLHACNASGFGDCFAGSPFEIQQKFPKKPLRHSNLT
jgi:hypothetical protein